LAGGLSGLIGLQSLNLEEENRIGAAGADELRMRLTHITRLYI